MGTAFRLLLAVVVVALVVRCTFYLNEEEPCPSASVPVERVFWHEYSRYSFLVKGSDGKMTTRSFPLRSVYAEGAVDIVSDVPADQSMRVELQGCTADVAGNRVIRYDHMTIHLHSPADVNGAGWNHGKHGRGTTTVVE